MRALATNIGLFSWAVLAQALFPIYNTALDLVLLAGALVPGLIMLVRRRTGPALLRVGVALSAAALVHRFSSRLLGLLREEGHQAVGPLCLAHLWAFVLALILTFAVFSRRGFAARVASAALFGFLLILGMGIAAPDFMVDVQLKYALGRSIEARRGLERAILTFSNVSGRERLDEAIRTCSRFGLLSLSRFQLESLSDRFFDSPFADDARLVAEVLLGPKPRDEALAGLEPLLLSRRFEFEIEGWTALKLSDWTQLFRSQAVSREMLLDVADRRIRAGQLADAEAALNAVIASGNGPDAAKAIGMLLGIYDKVLHDVEGGLNCLGRVLAVIPECAFLPAAREALGRVDESTHQKLESIASTEDDDRMRALAHLRLFFSAEYSSDEASASRHLDELVWLSNSGLGSLDLGLRLYRHATRLQRAAGLRVIRAGIELCEGFEAPFLLLASQLDMPDELSDVHEIALRRLVALQEGSLFFHDGLSQLTMLLLKQGRQHEANELLIMHSEHLDLLSDDDLARRASDLLRQY